MSLTDFGQIEKHWSLVTEKANKLFQKGNNQSAIKYYQQALFYSQSMLSNAYDAEKLNVQIASPFFVSCLRSTG